MTEHDDPYAVLRRFALSAEDVQRHVMLPDHVRDASVRAELPVELPVHRRLRAFEWLYTLDVRKLGSDLFDLLSPCVMGYALELRRSGSVVWTQQWRWSKTYADGLTGWSTDTPMHLASVSKLITAMAMTRLLNERGISRDARIDPWLPHYWPRGSNVGNLRFRHLLTHTSGLFGSVHAGVPGPCDFQAMKAAIADGSTDLVTPDYKNVNFSLCRILLATVNGDLDPAFLSGPPTPVTAVLLGIRDPVWDILTIRAYAQYVNDRVFAPAGVAARAFEHSTAAALAYHAPPDPDNGWDSQDLQAASGAVGWHLSVNELLRVMAAFRRSGKIVSPARAEAMLVDRFGLDIGWPRFSGMGPIYAKGGWWEYDGRVEQSNAFLLPGRMELVILANSPLCEPGTSFMSQVGQAIEDNIRPRYEIFLERVAGSVRRGP